MKHLIFAALLALPGVAAASLGPSVTQSEAALAQQHVVSMAWLVPGGAPTPDCTKPTPVVDTTLYACVVFPAAE